MAPPLNELWSTESCYCTDCSAWSGAIIVLCLEYGIHCIVNVLKWSLRPSSTVNSSAKRLLLEQTAIITDL